MPTSHHAAAWPAISAHRGGREAAPAGTWDAFAAAVHAGTDYVEFDARLTRDRTWVVFHNSHAGRPRRPVAELSYAQLCVAAGYAVPRVDDVMRLIAGRAVGHVDLKVDTDEESIVGMATDILGARGFVATTESVASIRRIAVLAPRARTALSTGHPALPPSPRVLHALRGRLFGMRHILDSGAEWVALNHQLATERVLGRCHGYGIGVMLWTVNNPALINRYLADVRVDVLVTDLPRYASARRSELVSAAPSGGAGFLLTGT